MTEKRKRGVNFSREETDVLIELVAKYKHIVENKKSDAVTWKEKEKIWNEIGKEFTSTTGETRTAKCLRNKYEILKKTTRKKSAEIRQNIFKTGGGKDDTQLLDPGEEKIKNIILMSVEGLQNPFDSDVDKDISTGNNSVNIQELIEEATLQLEETSETKTNTGIYASTTTETISTEVDNVEIWDTWNPSVLKTPINPSLKKGKSSSHGKNQLVHERYAEVAERKIKLIETKEELLRKEYEERNLRETEKHQLEMELLKIKLKLENQKFNGCKCHLKN